MKIISRNEIVEMLSQGGNLALVDALPKGFYDRGHFPKVICLPSEQVAKLAVLPDKGQLIVVYCSGSGCQNSVNAVEELHDLGYADVRRYFEGKADWLSG